MTSNMDGGGARLANLLRTAVWGGAGLLMLAPFVASLITNEMNWSPFDYGVWGAMLLAGCGSFEVAMRLSDSWAYRAGAVVAIGAAFLLVWINSAVGVIGSEDHPANLMYAGVLGLGVVGAALAGFKARGMGLTLFAMAAAHGVIAALTLAYGWGSGESEAWLPTVIGANVVFAAMWALSGGLFRRAAGEQARA